MASITIVTGVVGYYLSVRLHNMMVFSVLHSEMEKFLDRIPIGRIINRFSRDIDEVDKKVYSFFSYLLRINA
jgi:ABC-type multidrug transport system fused ATPase/permease subunit